MLNHTKRIKEIYEEIQRKLFYMIPEKWEKLYLYSSVLDKPDQEGKKGELFFYYIPKGIFKKKPVNVYEIPSKFNLDENQYFRLVQLLYAQIKELRQEFQKSNNTEIWTNLTLSIQNLRFHIDFDYTDLNHSVFSSYERHVIWRYEYLGIGETQVSKQDKEILRRYFLGAKTLSRKEHYDAGIYIRDIQNVIAYSTSGNNREEEQEPEQKSEQESEQKQDKKEIKYKNQILASQERLKKQKDKEKKEE